jgi:internalin A
MVARFGDPFRPLEGECKVVQFSQPLLDDDLRRAGELLRERPDVELYVYGRAARDLGFLRHFPGLARLHLSLYELDDIAGFAHVAESLEELNFDRTKKTFPLGFLGEMPHLERLFLVGHKKDIAVIRKLAGLGSLGLSGITLADLSLLLPLERLRKLSLLLGGTRDLGLLSRLPALEELFVMRITRLADLGVLGELATLRKLRLDWMRDVTALPSLAELARLNDVTLDTMKGLTSLEAIAAAPALRRLSVTNVPSLSAASFRCLLGHPSLAELFAYVGKETVNAEVKRMFPGIAR